MQKREVFRVGYVYFILSLNFILTTILFNLMNLIPEVNKYLCGGLSTTIITWEMLWLLVIAISLMMVDRSVRKFFGIPFYMVFAPLYGLVLMLIIKTINPTLEPLELMEARLLFFGLYFVLLGGYAWVETYLKPKFSRES